MPQGLRLAVLIGLILLEISMRFVLALSVLANCPMFARPKWLVAGFDSGLLPRIALSYWYVWAATDES